MNSAVDLDDQGNLTNSSAIVYPLREPLYIVIPITVIYSVIFLTGLIGNVGTCFVIARNKYMHTATNYYLFSLAVSDLLLLLSGLPVELYLAWRRYPYVFGEAFCVLRGIAAETSTNASILTITAFTVERYVAICHPLLSHTLSNLSRAVKLICVIWILSLVCAIPQAIQFGVAYLESPDGNLTTEITEYSICMSKYILFTYSFEVSTFVFFVLPMVIISVLYLLIGVQLRSSAQKSIHQKTFKAFRESNSRHSKNSRRGVIKMLIAVVVGFFICWGPFHAQRLLANYGDPQSKVIVTIYDTLTYISGVLYFVSTTINPILYHILSNKFRAAFKSTLFHLCNQRCGARKAQDNLSNYHSHITLTELDNNHADSHAHSRRRSRGVTRDDMASRCKRNQPQTSVKLSTTTIAEPPMGLPNYLRDEVIQAAKETEQGSNQPMDDTCMKEICAKNNMEFLL